MIVQLQSVENQLKKKAEIPLWWQCISWNTNQDTVLCEMVSAHTLHKTRNPYFFFCWIAPIYRVWKIYLLTIEVEHDRFLPQLKKLQKVP